jgi:putative peptide zinc metalloprotease protein
VGEGRVRALTVVETRVSVWEALAGRAPGQPIGPADPGLWAAVVERLNPARAKPRLRAGIEQAHLVSVRDVPYVMLRSPDDVSPRPPAAPRPGRTCYLRLTPDEVKLAGLMDGTRTVARLVAEFARISGRLAPDQVTRIVADLAGNRMLDELPVDAFRPLDRMHRRPWPARLGRGLLAAAKGQRMVVANADQVVGFLYRAGGRALFTRPAAVLMAIVALAGLGVFGWTWLRGDQSVFLTGGSYAAGAAVLLGLNVLALACHELGHALATKHAGRRVPSAGFLVYFGIPSVFVDTTDVWMAGRHRRLLTTAAGPGAGLILAGAAQLVGLAFPELAPWTFKLSFAWYLNALFNLNPFLALDGYYLLMDWLELPNLRARGMAWVVARTRRRPPRWGQLDREGRLVALYGVLAVLWLVIAGNLAYRIYSDRVSGLITGLWRAGFTGRLLLLAVIAGLAAPIVYVLVGWLNKRARRMWREWRERHLAADTPRRLAALNASALARLPASALQRLAAEARWVRPRTGEQLVFAGAAQSAVYVVVDGALEARRPGDPGGMVRERVGAGGVVGLANAITGSPSSLAWHTAGTTLLSLPASTVAASVGPLPGPLPADKAEAEELFEYTPALTGLSTDDRLGLLARSRPAHLPPGAPVSLSGPNDAVVIAAGIVELPDGTPLRRGTMIGPAGEQLTRPVAIARTPVRLWHLPAVAGLPLLLGSAGSSGVSDPGQGPAFGAHPPAAYPPLAAPPGAPPPDVDDSADRRFERAMWWLVALFLLIALMLTGSNFLPGPVWAEMPADKALLSAERGRLAAVVNGKPVSLAKGDHVYVGENDSVRVLSSARGRLTFRGGSATILCAGSETRVGRLWSEEVRPVSPSGSLELVGGRILADTGSTSGAFSPMRLQVGNGGKMVVNEGQAWYSVDPVAVTVSDGIVRVDGSEYQATGADLTCGDGVPVAPPAGTPTETPTIVPNPSPNPSPTQSPSPSPSLSPTPNAPQTTGAGNGPSATAGPVVPPPPRTTPGGTSPTPPRSPSTGPSTSSPTPESPTPPPPNEPPTITWVTDPGGSIAQDVNGQACSGSSTQAFPVVSVKDDHDSPADIKVTVIWSGFADGSAPMSWDGNFYGSVGPIPYSGQANEGGTISISVTATDSQGKTSRIDGTSITVDACRAGTVS